MHQISQRHATVAALFLSRIMRANPLSFISTPKTTRPDARKKRLASQKRQPILQPWVPLFIGVSKDPVKKHDKFVAKYDLGIPLISDEDGNVCENYGVWVEKSMYGKTYMGIERATYLIGADGKIAQIWRKVKVPGHVEAVLNALREQS